MTSVVDKSYRRIIQNIDNVRMKFDISTLLVKSKEHDSKIDMNKNNISENLTLINSKSDIIEDNKSNITNNYNISQINKKKTEFNTTLIDNNKNSINSIKNDIENYYKLKDIIIFDIEKTNIPEDVYINSPKFVVIQYGLNNNFKKDCYLEFDSSILTFFNRHYIKSDFSIYY